MPDGALTAYAATGGVSGGRDEFLEATLSTWIARVARSCTIERWKTTLQESKCAQMTERIRVAFRPEWHDLPIQPPAGQYRRALRYPIVTALVSVAAIPAGYFIRSDIWTMLWAGILVVAAVIGIAGSAVAYRPYREERKLGYTTWPSAPELQQSRGGGSGK
ncbi:hypothetical protein [Oryzihumus leptocrescens]|uniref:hypothetical protein n=1 Tax=Oryzihumus leptocrescens TaxID=297536 RepID=UPI001153720D|nr:hypothetical protein [Oryzihumus leptocrescens]